jgi:hypothetical protein
MKGHLVLLGDSVFDNPANVASGHDGGRDACSRWCARRLWGGVVDQTAPLVLVPAPSMLAAAFS